MSADGVADAVRHELEKFVDALVADGDLRRWFESMVPLGHAERKSAFLAFADEMQAAGEHPELVRVTGLLALSEVFDGVHEVLRIRLLQA